MSSVRPGTIQETEPRRSIQPQRHDTRTEPEIRRRRDVERQQADALQDNHNHNHNHNYDSTDGHDDHRQELCGRERQRRGQPVLARWLRVAVDEHHWSDRPGRLHELERVHRLERRAVYNGLNVNGEITVRANNVTIENSNITDEDPDNAAIQVASGVTGVKILNDSIHGTNAVQSGSLAYAVSNLYGTTLDSVTIDHTNFYNGDRILSGFGTVTNSYCLGGAVFSTNGNVEHDECIYTSGAAPGIRAIHDTLINANPAQTAAIFVDNPDYGGGGTAGTLDVENSLLAGGDYCLYGGNTNLTSGGSVHTGPETVTGNRFSTLFFNTCGTFGPHVYIAPNVVWSGNVWDNTGNKVSSP